MTDNFAWKTYSSRNTNMNTSSFILALSCWLSFCSKHFLVWSSNCSLHSLRYKCSSTSDNMAVFTWANFIPYRMSKDCSGWTIRCESGRGRARSKEKFMYPIHFYFCNYYIIKLYTHTILFSYIYSGCGIWLFKH